MFSDRGEAIGQVGAEKSPRYWLHLCNQGPSLGSTPSSAHWQHNPNNFKVNTSSDRSSNKSHPRTLHLLIYGKGVCSEFLVKLLQLPLNASGPGLNTRCFDDSSVYFSPSPPFFLKALRRRKEGRGHIRNLKPYKGPSSDPKQINSGNFNWIRYRGQRERGFREKDAEDPYLDTQIHRKPSTLHHRHHPKRRRKRKKNQVQGAGRPASGCRRAD